MIEAEELQGRLTKLTGKDFERAERYAKQKNMDFDPGSLSFYGQLAALALDIPYPEFQSKPLVEYVRVCSITANFLNAEYVTAQSASSIERSQSDARSSEESSIG